MQIGNVQAVTGRLPALDVHGNVAPATDPFSIDRRGTGHRRQDLLQTSTDGLDLRQLRPGHLDPHRCLDPRGQHVDPRLDRHDPGVGQAGEGHQRIQFPLEGFGRHARAPFVPRLQLDKGLDHGQWRGVGGSLGAADLAKYRRHLGHRGNQPVGLLQDLARLADRQPRIRGGHVHQVALVHVGDELTADPRQGPQPGQGDRKCQAKGETGVPQYAAQHRQVE